MVESGHADSVARPAPTARGFHIEMKGEQAMEAALMWSWDGVIPGRNALAKELAHDCESFFAGHAAAGRSSKVEWFADPTFANRQLYVVRGDAEALAGISMSPEHQMLAMRCKAILENPSQAMYYLGDSNDTLWAGWWETVAAIEG